MYELGKVKNGGSCSSGVGYVGAGVGGLCRGGEGLAFFSNLH